MSKVVEVETVEELEDIVASNDKVIVDFAAESWCVPCQRLKPHYEAASDRVEDTVFVHADIDLHPDLQRQYNIMGVPTLRAYKGGLYVAELPNNVRTVVTLVKYAESL